MVANAEDMFDSVEGGLSGIEGLVGSMAKVAPPDSQDLMTALEKELEVRPPYFTHFACLVAIQELGESSKRNCFAQLGGVARRGVAWVCQRKCLQAAKLGWKAHQLHCSKRMA